jgi:DNA-damage-inducible protein D
MGSAAKFSPQEYFADRYFTQAFDTRKTLKMTDKHIATQHHATFEGIRHVDEEGHEFWLARELADVLEYSQYRHFLPVIERAREASKKSGQPVEDHMEDVLTMVDIGSGAKRQVEDVRLTRYACYLIVQNGDPSKPVIANGQTYFALQTRRQELADNVRFVQLSEDEKRLAIRHEMANHNKHLAAAAKVAGVETPIDYAIFQDHGYRGLYGGMSAKDIHASKELKKSQKILDHMGSTELAANLFRATQTEEKLKRDEVNGKKQANQTHFQVGQTVRNTIEELGGTMPETLPTPNNSIKKIETAAKKLEQKKT